MNEILYSYEELEKLVAEGEVAKRPHQTKPLFIYSYLKTFYPEWTNTLRWARGLILDKNGDLIACPFKKFFNYSEIKAEVDKLIADGVGHRIQDKLDGSLGILFYYRDEWIISTKGSFHSEQAQKATELLHTKYAEYLKDLDIYNTYLFEIIYPENQIVVKYDHEALVLLAVMNPNTMKELRIEVNWPHKVKHFNHLSISDVIKDMSRPDYCSSEGFIVVFDEGTRVKFKYDEYVKLHKIVSDFKPANVVELMKAGGNVDELIASLPDEFRQELIDVAQNTRAKYESICIELLYAFNYINSPDKKMFALEAVKRTRLRALLFEMWKSFYAGKLRFEPAGVSYFISQVRNSKMNEMVYDIILEEL